MFDWQNSTEHKIHFYKQLKNQIGKENLHPWSVGRPYRWSGPCWDRRRQRPPRRSGRSRRPRRLCRWPAGSPPPPRLRQPNEYNLCMGFRDLVIDVRQWLKETVHQSPPPVRSNFNSIITIHHSGLRSDLLNTKLGIHLSARGKKDRWISMERKIDQARPKKGGGIQRFEWKK